MIVAYGALLHAQPATNPFGIQFEKQQVRGIWPTSQPGKWAFRFNYADSVFVNAGNFEGLAPNERVLRVDIVYTAYPRDTGKWLTPYNNLLFARIRALQRLMPQTRSCNDWRLVEQTACTTAKLAKKFYHGVVVYTRQESAPDARAIPSTAPQPAYKPTPKPSPQRAEPPTAAETVSPETTEATKPTPETLLTAPPNPNATPVRQRPAPQPSDPNITPDSLATLRRASIRRMLLEISMGSVREVASGRAKLKDPIVLKTLEANRASWDSLLVVVDWTASMYEYGAQIVRWYRDSTVQDKIRFLVFFNDGDDYAKPPNYRGGKPIGNTGGIHYNLTPQNTASVLDTMEAVIRAGGGGEDEENDVEAVLRSQQRFRGKFKQTVLIADNASPVRDLELADSLLLPVHIILCGVPDVPYAEQYLTIAWKTGGSVTSTGEKITFAGRREEVAGRIFVVNGRRYTLQRNAGEFRAAR